MSACNVTIILIISPNLAVTISIVVFLGICYALYLPAWNSFIASYIPENLKEAGWGIFSALQGFGVMIGPTVGSILAHQNNIITTIQFSAGIFGLTAVIYLFIHYGIEIRIYCCNICLYQ
ncbi:MFS transporter [Oceanobacillus sp. 143]|nr:MFS transporter [Oceanobacillus sp. 143]